MMTLTKMGPEVFCPRENCPYVDKLICPYFGNEDACRIIPADEQEDKPRKKRKS